MSVQVLGLALALTALMTGYARAGESSTLELEHPELEKAKIFKPENLPDAKPSDEEMEARVEAGDLQPIGFDFDSYKIRADYYLELNLLARYMLLRPHKKLLMTAHTCRIGTGAYNTKLSFRRAKAVRDYLIKQGVLPSSIRYRAKYFTEPVGDNSTPEGRAKNRRVELHILTRDWSSVY